VHRGRFYKLVFQHPPAYLHTLNNKQRKKRIKKKEKEKEKEKEKQFYQTTCDVSLKL